MWITDPTVGLGIQMKTTGTVGSSTIFYGAVFHYAAKLTCILSSITHLLCEIFW